VVVPDARGPRDLVVHGRTGYPVEPRDDAAFAAELMSTVDRLRHAPLRERLGAAGRVGGLPHVARGVRRATARSVPPPRLH